MPSITATGPGDATQNTLRVVNAQDDPLNASLLLLKGLLENIETNTGNIKIDADSINVNTDTLEALIEALATVPAVTLLSLGAPSAIDSGDTEAATPSTDGVLVDALSRSGKVRVSVAVSFAAAATGEVTVNLVTSQDGTNYDTAGFSGISLVAVADGQTALVFSDWFDIAGVKKISVGNVVNDSDKNITACAVKLTY